MTGRRKNAPGSGRDTGFDVGNLPLKLLSGACVILMTGIAAYGILFAIMCFM